MSEREKGQDEKRDCLTAPSFDDIIDSQSVPFIGDFLPLTRNAPLGSPHVLIVHWHVPCWRRSNLHQMHHNFATRRQSWRRRVQMRVTLTQSSGSVESQCLELQLKRGSGAEAEISLQLVVFFLERTKGAKLQTIYPIHLIKNSLAGPHLSSSFDLILIPRLSWNRLFKDRTGLLHHWFCCCHRCLWCHWVL